MSHNILHNPFANVLAMLCDSPLLRYELDPPDTDSYQQGEWWITVTVGQRSAEMVYNFAKGGYGLYSAEESYGYGQKPDSLTYDYSEAAAHLRAQLGMPPQPDRKADPGFSYPPEETKIREELVPLAAMVGGNVVAYTMQFSDAHFPMQICDGLHNELEEVRGALDGLMTAVQHDGWEIKRTGPGHWEKFRAEQTAEEGAQ